MDSHSVLDKIRCEEGELELQQIYKLFRVEFIVWARKEYGIHSDEAREIFQQVIIIFYENVINDKLRVLESGLRTYLFAIGKNKIRELIREGTKHTGVDAYDYMIEPNAFSDESANEYKMKVTKVRKSLDVLGEPCKSVLVDFYYKKRKIKEIMIDFKYKNEVTTRTQKYRCLQRLKKIYFSAHHSLSV